MRQRIHVKAGGYVQGHRLEPRFDGDVLAVSGGKTRRPHRLPPANEPRDGPARTGAYLFHIAYPVGGSLLGVGSSGALLNDDVVSFEPDKDTPKSKRSSTVTDVCKMETRHVSLWCVHCVHFEHSCMRFADGEGGIILV